MSFIPSIVTNAITQVDNIFDYIDNILEEPNNISSEIDEKYQKKKFKEMKDILEIVEDFIINRKGILYGGTALNMLLPNDYKFYGKYEIPDYDFFSDEADMLAKDIADALKNAGYKYTEVKHALHEGTYKVYCNFESVADVTSLRTTDYKILLRNAEFYKKKGKKMLICPIPFLKAVAYKELCMPIGSSFRWTKVYKRLLLIESVFPSQFKSTKLIKGECNDIFMNEYLSEKYIDVQENTKHFIKKNNYVNIGNEAILYYIKDLPECSEFGTDEYDKKAMSLQILSKNIKKTSTEYVKYMKSIYGKDIKVTSKVYDDLITFVPKKSTIYIKLLNDKKYNKVLTIYDASEHCFSITKNEEGDLYGSIFFLYYITYFKILLQSNDKIKNKIYNLTLILLSKVLLNENEDRLLEIFTEKCYGEQKTLSAVKRSIWDNNKKIMYYRP